MTGWDELLGSLARAGEVVCGPLGGRTEREVAEGYRHLTRVFAIAAEMLVEKGDPAHPAFTRWMTPYRKMYGDNPRTVYDTAVVSADHTYVVTGTRGTAAYLGFCLYGTAPDGAKRIAGNLDDDELTVGVDGHFTLRLGGPAAEDNWLALDPDVTEIIVRQYFVDPDAEHPAAYTIDTSPPAGPPPPLELARFEARLAQLGRYVLGTVEAETTLSALSASIAHAGDGPADLPLDTSAIARVMPTPAIQYSGQWFDDLGEDEVIVVEGTVPDCRYWSVQLLTRFMESGDWLHHPVYRTGSDIASRDGRFRVAVAHRDPGLGTWLSTTGLTSGNLAVRALKASGPLDVTFRRVRRDDERGRREGEGE